MGQMIFIANGGGGAGPGTGDVVGPASSNDGTIVLFDGITGKLIQDSGILPDPFIGDAGFGGTMGFVPAPAAGDAAAFKFLSANGNWETIGGVAGASYRTSFTDADLVLGVLTVIHNLAVNFNTWAVYDNLDTCILPDSVLNVDGNTLAVDLSPYQAANGGAIPGTWNVVVQS